MVYCVTEFSLRFVCVFEAGYHYHSFCGTYLGCCILRGVESGLHLPLWHLRSIWKNGWWVRKDFTTNE